jgi:hypothetical protein
MEPGRETRPLPALEAAARTSERQMVLLGDPGGGKSTFVNYLALCLAGGVAYNSVAVGQVLKQTPFKDVFVQPAAGDSGTALGVAYYLWNMVLGNARSHIMTSAYLGPDYSEVELEQALRSYGASFQKCQNIEEIAAKLLAEGKIVGWFQGRMEFGPRALGNRSILADPRQPGIKEVLNRRIKHRESFRPFAPAVLEECVDDYFEDASPSRFMLLVFKVRPEKRPSIPANRTRGPHGAHSVSLEGEQPSVLESHRRLQAADWNPSCPQYVVQRERTDRLLSRGRSLLLCDHPDGRSCLGQLPRHPLESELVSG